MPMDFFPGPNFTVPLFPASRYQPSPPTSVVFTPEMFGGSRGNAGADDFGAITKAITAAANVNGGDVVLPTGTSCTSDEVIIQNANVRLIGQGGDTQHDSGSGVVPATTLKWIGATDASKAVVRVRTPTGAGSNVITGSGVERLAINANAAAGIGLAVTSLRVGKFSNLFVQDATADCYKVTALISGTETAEAADTQNCLFERCTFRVIDSAGVQSANGFNLDGSSNANTSYNHFRNCDGQHWNGVAFLQTNTDNNVLMNCAAFRAGGTGYTFDLKADCRTNYFIGCTWDSVNGFIVRTPSTSGLAGANFVLTNDYTNSSQTPVLEAGATIVGPYWIQSSPTPTSGGGTITTKTLNVFTNQLSEVVHVFGELTITTVGTATGDIIFTLPIPAAQAGAIGAAWNRSTGDALFGCWMANTTQLTLAFNGVAIANNTYNFSITYQGT